MPVTDKNKAVRTRAQKKAKEAEAAAPAKAAAQASPVVISREYRDVAMEQIAEGDNYRRTYNQEKLQELADSIRDTGLAQPILIRPKKGKGGALYQLVVGTRRFRAAKLAGLSVIPCAIEEMSDTRAMEVQLVENLQRSDVHPLEEADGMHRLMQAGGYSARELATRLGKKSGWVHKRLKLRDAAEPVKKAFREKQITPDAALLIARESEEAQRELLPLATDRHWTVRQLSDHIQRKLRRDVRKGGFDPKAETLIPEVGSCFKCPKLAGNAADLHAGEKKTTCTDVGCYEQKQLAAIQVKTEQAKAAGSPLLKVETSYRGYADAAPKGVLPPDQYRKIDSSTKACKAAVEAIITYGEGLAQTITVCADKTCKTHFGSSSSFSSDAEREKARKEKRELETAKAVRGKLVDALLDGMSVIPESLTLEQDFWLVRLLEEWVEAAWGRLWNDAKRLVIKRHAEWDADTISVGDLKLPALLRLMNEITLAGHLMVTWYGDKKVSDSLAALCEEYNVPWKQIEAEVRAKSDEPRKKGGKKSADGPARRICIHDGCVGYSYAPHDEPALCVEHQGEGTGHPEREQRGPVVVVEGIESYAEGLAAVGNYEYLMSINTAASLQLPDGTFAERSCLSLESALGARVLLIRTADGWRESFQYALGKAKHENLPHFKGKAYSTARTALIDALGGLMAAIGVKNAKGPGKKIVDWAQALWKSAVDSVDLPAVHAEAEGGTGTFDDQIPADRVEAIRETLRTTAGAVEEAVQAPEIPETIQGDDLPSMTRCEYCGVIVTAAGLDSHLQFCDAAKQAKAVEGHE